MRPKLITISLITLVLLGLFLSNFPLNFASNQIQAQGEITEEPLPEEPLFEESEFPLGLSIPGRIEGTGTHFDLEYRFL